MQTGSFAHYRIVGRIGSGGMGEVYRATDTRLGRDVALKVLPEGFAADPARMARFQREAQLLASLNHPNIAAIHGVEESGGVRCLVLELVDGPTLAERIAEGQMPLDEALVIARQIADALESAHDKGIIHRDLKPANVKLTREGMVKFLDFGLAKALEADTEPPELSTSPTITAAATRAGIILGTAAYMSPEQAKGKAVDRRADVWSFGVLLLEMLSGRRAYTGETASETLASVIKDEPPVGSLPASVPEHVRRLLGRCLERDPRRRLQAIGEARIAIDDHLADPSGARIAGSAPAAASAWRRSAPWMITAVLAAALMMTLATPWRGRPRPAPPLRVNVSISADKPLYTEIGPAVIISPDGKRIAWVSGSPRKLHTRMLDRLEETELAGTESAINPFFSPDGEWIGFFVERYAKKVAVVGGAPLTVWEMKNGRGEGRGGAWGDDDTIVFTPGTTHPLMRVPAGGGDAHEVTKLDAGQQEASHRWPQFLPDGVTIIYSSLRADAGWDDARIIAQRLDTGERKVLHEGGYHGRYLPTGHLVYVRQGTLFAVPFDAGRLRLTGSPAPILERVVGSIDNGGAQFSFSQTGTLIHMTGDTPESKPISVVWMDREGRAEPLLKEPGFYLQPRFSPDGRRLALTIRDRGTGPPFGDIWIYEFERGTLMRLTFDGENIMPQWTADGAYVTYAARGKGTFRKRADGVGEAERLFSSDEDLVIPTWSSPDGKAMVAIAAVGSAKGAFPRDLNVSLVRQDGARSAGASSVEPVLSGPFVETWPTISPDGRWMAYVSTESGREQVYVSPAPRPGRSSSAGRWQVSIEGGSYPQWSPSGRELFYVDRGGMMAVTYSASGESFVAGKPQQLFQPGFLNMDTYTYDVAPDGKRFAILAAARNEQPAEVHPTMVLNWFDEVRRLVPPVR